MPVFMSFHHLLVTCVARLCVQSLGYLYTGVWFLCKYYTISTVVLAHVYKYCITCTVVLHVIFVVTELGMVFFVSACEAIVFMFM